VTDCRPVAYHNGKLCEGKAIVKVRNRFMAALLKYSTRNILLLPTGKELLMVNW